MSIQASVEEILEDIKNDKYLNKQWNIYKKENNFIHPINECTK